MPDDETMLLAYLRLAAVAQHRLKPYQRDNFLVLVAAAAAGLGRWDLAEACRAAVLRNNPGHMLKHFPSIHSALTDEDFHPFLRKLQRQWTYERAEHVLTHPDVEGTEPIDLDESALVTLLGLAN